MTTSVNRRQVSTDGPTQGARFGRNTLCLVGALTADPRRRDHFDQDSTVVEMDLQVDRFNEGSDRFRVVAFGDLAVHVAESLRAGDRIIVFGRLQRREWSSRTEQHATVEVVASEIAPSLRWTTATVRKVPKAAA